MVFPFHNIAAVCVLSLIIEMPYSSAAAVIFPDSGKSDPVVRIISDERGCIDVNSASQFSFLDALSAAICASIDIRKNNAVIDEKQANKLKSLAPYLPKIDFVANGNRFSKSVGYKDFPGSGYDLKGRNGDLNLALNWLLYDFGARSANREGTLHILNAALSDREYVVRKLIDSTADAYFKAIAARDTLISASESESSAKEGAEIASALVSHGAQSISDRLLAQGAYEQAVLQRIDAESERNTAFAELATLFGLARSAKIDMEATPTDTGASLSVPPQTLITELIDNNPRVQYFREEMLAAESRLAATQAESRPTLSLVANSYRSLTPPDESTVAQTINGWSIGLQLKIPIFEGFAHHANVQAASAQLIQKQMDLESAKRDAEVEIWNSEESLRKNREKVTVAKSAVEYARQAYEAAKVRYRNGVGSILELLKGQTDYAEARRAYIKVYADWNVAKVKFATSTENRASLLSGIAH